MHKSAKVLLTLSQGAGYPSWFPQNRKVVYYTDSMGSPSGATNIFYGHPWQSLQYAGTLHHPPSLLLVRDQEGQNATTIVANFLSHVDADRPTVAVLQAGTNADADIAAFQTAVTAFVYGCLSRRIKPVVTAAIPKASSQGTSERDRLSAQRDWLVANAAALGFALADAWAATQVSGYLPADCVNVDGIHPNDKGHTKIARVEGAAIKSSMRPVTQSLVQQWSAYNLINGLMTGALGGGSPTGWVAGTPTPTGTAPTLSKVAAPGDGFVLAGQGYEFDLTAAADTSWRRAHYANSGFSVGDKILAVLKLRVDPLAEDWEGLTVVNKTAKANLLLSNGNSGAAISAGINTAALDQEFAYTYTVASGVTSLIAQINFILPNLAHAKATGFEAGIFPLTTMGLAGVVLN
jgi:hypothetical protein